MSASEFLDLEEAITLANDRVGEMNGWHELWVKLEKGELLAQLRHGASFVTLEPGWWRRPNANFFRQGIQQHTVMLTGEAAGMYYASDIKLRRADIERVLSAKNPRKRQSVKEAAVIAALKMRYSQRPHSPDRKTLANSLSKELGFLVTPSTLSRALIGAWDK